jgi:hypothetical protein
MGPARLPHRPSPFGAHHQGVRVWPLRILGRAGRLLEASKLRVSRDSTTAIVSRTPVRVGRCGVGPHCSFCGTFTGPFSEVEGLFTVLICIPCLEVRLARPDTLLGLHDPGQRTAHRPSGRGPFASSGGSARHLTPLPTPSTKARQWWWPWRPRVSTGVAPGRVHCGTGRLVGPQVAFPSASERQYQQIGEPCPPTGESA